MIIGLNTLSERWPACGMHVYVRSLMKHLPLMGHAHTYVFLRPRPRVYEPGISTRKTFPAVAWELWGVQSEAKRRGVQLLHSPYWASPVFPSQPTVVTVPDVVPLLDLPGFEAYRSRAFSRIYYPIVAHAARKATAVISFSEAAAADVSRIIGIPPDRIHVTPLAARSWFRHESCPNIDRIRDRYVIRDAYILVMPAGFDYRKDISTALRAFSELRAEYDKPLQLVVAGDYQRLDLPAASEMDAVLSELGLRWQVDVVRTGIVRAVDLPALYSGAEALVNTSLYEGFGLSVLEAMACRTPVVVSDIEALRELCADAALYAPPKDPSAFAEQMLRLLSDRKEKDRLAKAARERADLYSWEKTTELTVDVYEKVFTKA